jgi:nitrite reductase/ring-hydroxylating ferredoxin subunit/uncharacterized membrane protein
MRSKAVLLGHPVHPMLIPFPFAFLTGAVFFDAAGWIGGVASWWTTGGRLLLAGIVTALIAAAPGLIDYVYTVPPASTGKTRATRHMIANLSATGLFAIAWLLRGSEPGLRGLAIEAIALGLLATGGYLGGTLVTRNLIGVDHRYANAGKWRDETIDTKPNGRVTVATRDDLKVDQMKLLRVNGRRIVLARTPNGYVAFDDRCTHRGGSLAGGVVVGGTVQCLWHGSQFDCATGAVRCGPASQPIRVYRVAEADGEIELTL